MFDDRPNEKREPHYNLARVKCEFRAGHFRPVRRVARHLRRRGWTLLTVQEVVCALEISDFHKSQDHWARENAWLDIYRPEFVGSRMYVKFTLLESGDGFLVLSFCRDGEPH